MATTVMALAMAGSAILALPALAATGVEAAMADLQHGWAKANYQTAEDQQEASFEALIAKAEDAVKANPGKPELLAWEAIILSSYAKVQGGFGAMDSAEKARDLLMEAAKIDDKALGGGIYTSLGALYYKVPGWPIGFGNDSKAKEYLERGLAMNPTGIDQNYFYGDFLLDQGEKDKAKEYLTKALNAPPRPGREDADAGRRQEITADLKLAGN
jgi:tetratricopeptide (TPR) repeat protein